MNILVDQELLLDLQHALNMIPNQRFSGRNGETTDSYGLASRLGQITRRINPLTSLDVYVNEDNDQPTTCPRCGARTNFYQMSPSLIQHHTCMNEKCRYEFVLEISDAVPVKQVDPENVELEGPYECPHCGGHIQLDATFLDQVSEDITCPYCQGKYTVSEP